ncbi:hypothetical protein NKH24_32600 [Mesorhizobium sp. M1300]|uniref:hypothetical protein n=1 Tax=Mesorhizobium sp. M1300 TaxID=2957077 RepID=UPI00333D4A22
MEVVDVAFVVIGIAPVRSEAKLSRSRKVCAVITGNLSQAGGRADPRMPEPISVLLSAHATPSIGASATHPPRHAMPRSWVRPQ